MRANEYLVLEMAIEQGVDLGFNRAHKHTDQPTPEQIKDAIHHAVLNEVCEWFTLEGENRE
jgi:hypothetical protein